MERKWRWGSGAELTPVILLTWCNNYRYGSGYNVMYKQVQCTQTARMCTHKTTRLLGTVFLYKKCWGWSTTLVAMQMQCLWWEGRISDDVLCAVFIICQKHWDGNSHTWWLGNASSQDGGEGQTLGFGGCVECSLQPRGLELSCVLWWGCLYAMELDYHRLPKVIIHLLIYPHQLASPPLHHPCAS